MKIAICKNEEKKESLTVEACLCEILSEQGISFYSVQGALLPDTDVLCVIGGDGTLFSNAHYAIECGLPIWFINAGSVGFLAESSVDLAERVALLKTGNYSVSSRDMLSVCLDGQTYTALNDVCLMRDTKHLQTVTLTVSADGEEVACYRGDGALVCTALGSTGYALSAGAPIMSPGAKGMLFTPICAHSLKAKSVLFGEGETVCLHSKESAVLFVDGVFKFVVDGASVRVCVSDKKVTFIATEKQTFFGKIGSKLL